MMRYPSSSPFSPCILRLALASRVSRFASRVRVSHLPCPPFAPEEAPMKLSDYVFSFLADRGVRHVFLVTGGGAMHLNDSLAQGDAHHARLPAPRAGLRHGGGGVRAGQRDDGSRERHHRAGRHQRTQRRLRSLDRFHPHARHLRTGEAGDLHGLSERAGTAPARRPGGGHPLHGQGDHQIRGHGARARGNPPSPGTGVASRAIGPPRALLDRHPGGRAGEPGGPRRHAGVRAGGGFRGSGSGGSSRIDASRCWRG